MTHWELEGLESQYLAFAACVHIRTSGSKDTLKSSSVG